MPKNSSVLDPKPQNSLAKDSKPNLRSANDPKPNMGINTGTENIIYYTQVIAKGQYMGIPPFTYPEAGTVQSPFNP